MKKLSFIFAMVFVASIAMAQTAVIEQISGISAPPSSQTATVTQNGESEVTILQETDKMEHPDGTASENFDHVAFATQSGGDGNEINITQIANGKINGGSIVNEAEAVQVGDKNTMNQTQVSGDYTSGGMDFESYQKGESNSGIQFGQKTESDFDLYQSGSGNISLQTTMGEKTGVLHGNVKQIGIQNDATQFFYGANVRWVGAEIYQEGQSNTAIQDFSSLATIWDEPSSADIIQRNSDNYAKQSQDGAGSYQKTEQYGTNNDATMYSVGNFNKAYTKQDGTNGEITIEQKQAKGLASIAADGNLAKIYQDGDDSEATIGQDGFRNKVVGLIGDDYAINNNGSELIVIQDGCDNIVRSYQTAHDATEEVYQTGMNNAAIVTQY